MSDLIQQSLFSAAPSAERLTPATPRDRAIDWAIRMVANPDVVYLDLETTGIGSDAEICDVGIVAADGSVLVDTLVRPENPIPAEAEAVHHISDLMVKDAPTFPEVIDTIRSAVGGKVLLVYNLGYDLPLINRVCQRYDLPPISLDIAGRGCAMLAYSDLIGELNEWGKPRWHKLDKAAERYGIPPGGHRALADAITARLVVIGMSKELAS